MSFLSFLNKGRVLMDGGMGSLLQARGLQPGEQPERWNLIHPEAILAVQRAYFEAGSNLVISNTFGANRFHYGTEELSEVIRAGVLLAKEARKEAGKKPEKRRRISEKAGPKMGPAFFSV